MVEKKAIRQGEAPENYPDLLELLKDFSKNNVLKRSRLCFHSDDSSDLHAMIVNLNHESQIQMHWHQKSEFYMILSGKLEIIIEHSEGEKCSFMLDAESQMMGRKFYYMKPGTKHSMKSISEFSTYLEVTKGPYESSKIEIPMA